jgi:hypothetical protein
MRKILRIINGVGELYVASCNLSVMRYFTLQNSFLILLLSFATIFAVACTSKAQLSEPIVAPQQSPKQTREIRPCETEPIYSLITNDDTSKNMKAAWKQFILNGRYRLACDSDADFALDAVEPKTIESYSIDKQSRSITNWGDWNYPRRAYDDHLAVIVIDTTRTDANRFGLVVFSAPKTKKNTYDVNWLYQNRDLSRASVGMASGSGWVQDYTTDGKRNFCWIVWNKNQKIFECKNTSR